MEKIEFNKDPQTSKHSELLKRSHQTNKYSFSYVKDSARSANSTRQGDSIIQGEKVLKNQPKIFLLKHSDFGHAKGYLRMIKGFELGWGLGLGFGLRF